MTMKHATSASKCSGSASTSTSSSTCTSSSTSTSRSTSTSSSTNTSSTSTSSTVMQLLTRALADSYVMSLTSKLLPPLLVLLPQLEQPRTPHHYHHHHHHHHHHHCQGVLPVVKLRCVVGLRWLLCWTCDHTQRRELPSVGMRLKHSTYPLRTMLAPVKACFMSWHSSDYALLPHHILTCSLLPAPCLAVVVALFNKRRTPARHGRRVSAPILRGSLYYTDVFYSRRTHFAATQVICFKWRHSGATRGSVLKCLGGFLLSENSSLCVAAFPAGLTSCVQRDVILASWDLRELMSCPNSCHGSQVSYFFGHILNVFTSSFFL
ncbi:hypothetical protein FHG87_004015 [Trinorchestia longiramus]|nr:hypothetical protein FHG87_004015 [Trinorchestia longiramus]